MGKQMLAYTREQPKIWKEILARRKEITKPFIEGQMNLPLRRFILIGSGSSFTASKMASELLIRLTGTEVSAIEPTRLETLLPLLDKECIFCVCSQSGRSTSTLAAIEAIHQAGHRVTAVTANLDSQVSQACDTHVKIECGDELVGPKTKGMSSSALTLTLMGMELALQNEKLSEEKYLQTVSTFEKSFDMAAENIERCVAWCACQNEFAHAPHMTIVADGTSLTAAMEGALKILETLYIPVGAYEFEEYLHGVANTINEQSYLIHLINDGKNRERMLALRAFSAEHHGHDAVISAGTPTGIEGELNLKSSGNELTLPFEMLLPFHAISAILSEKRGIDCDKPLFPDFIQRLHTKA